MSKAKKIYSVREAKSILKEHGYIFIRKGKHEIWELEIVEETTKTKMIYALTTSKDPMREGTMRNLISQLGYDSFEDFQNRSK